jgi:uncharacterized protein DUF4404
MAEQSPIVNLHDLAQKVREADSLGPQAQRAVADLLDDLAQAIPPATGSSTEATHLAESATHLADTLREPQKSNAVPPALERFETAVARAEAKAPLASGIARQIIEALANLGI